MATHTYLCITDDKGKKYTGNCKAKDHVGKIEVTSWNTNVMQEAVGASNKEKTGKPRSNPGVMTFAKFYDLSSDDLMYACWTGAKLTTCVFEIYRSAYPGTLNNVSPANKWFLKITLKNAYIAAYKIDGSGEEIPAEDIDICYEGIKFEYKAIDKKTGAVSDVIIPMEYDWQLNKKI